MQVPERLALIGGSILLSSLLIFGLRGQAANILPKVATPIQNINKETSTTPSMVQFNSGYQQAQQNGWQTGQWGNAPYYIDNDHNMHVGSGDLQVGHLRTVIGGDQADNLVTLSIDGNVKVGDATFSFSTSTDGDYRPSKLTTISGMGDVDMSSTTMMMNMFASDTSLKNIDLNRLDISHVDDMYNAFNTTPSLNVTTHWDLSHVNVFGAFDNTGLKNE